MGLSLPLHKKSAQGVLQSSAQALPKAVKYAALSWLTQPR